VQATNVAWSNRTAEEAWIHPGIKSAPAEGWEHGAPAALELRDQATVEPHPMLSHGGSRLNASKPEANPKTSCPNQRLFAVGALFVSAGESRWIPLALLDKQEVEQRRFLGFGALELCGKNFKTNRLSNERCVRSLDGAKYMKNSRDFSFSHIPQTA
jgi:hypothetical protein